MTTTQLLSIPSIAISLGWNCYSAIWAVEHGLRPRKDQGYQTCPFDLMVSNYQGVCDCLERDFDGLTDPSQLEIRTIQGCPMIYHKYYHFMFNHESPGHANLHIKESWKYGPMHFVENNFQRFCERYNQRIANFRNYVQSCSHIFFTMSTYNFLPTKLETILRHKYPHLSFSIFSGVNVTPQDYFQAQQNEQQSRERCRDLFKELQCPESCIIPWENPLEWQTLCQHVVTSSRIVPIQYFYVKK